MRELIEVLNTLKGKYVNIYTSHKLFGPQHVEMEFEPETEVGIGFRCRDQVIYIDKEDIVDYQIDDNVVTITGKMMHIRVVTS